MARIEVQPGALHGGAGLHRHAAASVLEMAGALHAAGHEAAGGAPDAPDAATGFGAVHGPAMAHLGSVAQQAAENLAAAAGVYADTDATAIQADWT
jgi:hypothetical protein